MLRRRLYGNKAERCQTSELQLTLGNLLDAEKQLQKQLDEAVAKAQSDAGNDTAMPGDSSKPKPKPKPKGRRDVSLSKLPRVVIEILHEELEKTGKRIASRRAFS